MLKKLILVVLLALFSDKLSAQIVSACNPPINAGELPCEYTVCLTALDRCR